MENIISFRYTEGSKYKAFENWCLTVKKESDAALKASILQDFHLMEHLKMIKSFFLLGQGDLINNLIENLQSELGQPASKLFRYTLASILDTAKQTTSAQNHKQEYLEKVTVKLLQPQPG